VRRWLKRWTNNRRARRNARGAVDKVSPGA